MAFQGVDFILKEFEKLKDEQNKRIEFRDQMIYLTLAAIGTVFSFALGNPKLAVTLLVLPFVCLIMGWTYLANDLKITQINSFIKDILIDELNKRLTVLPIDATKSWESFVIKDRTRVPKKKIQLMVDLFTFVLPAFIAIISFYIKSSDLSWYDWLIMDIELATLVFLTWQFYKAAK
ncbi:hypothetical protein BDD43_0504 [Mucilaginibacter gracilis]|uniref:Integral membrane protein n=1 Tax=Mucilaginibacter gracilis TaxID=423350 RepID=A0A495IX12_9SPHI|nr:hypothetical protein [Mucilaginibacter gracilis]RKR80399.1 hypothetical protein BDD43_0504 [Mucilaginibacter gracilis]